MYCLIEASEDSSGRSVGGDSLDGSLEESLGGSEDSSGRSVGGDSLDGSLEESLGGSSLIESLGSDSCISMSVSIGLVAGGTILYIADIPIS